MDFYKIVSEYGNRFHPGLNVDSEPWKPEEDDCAYCGISFAKEDILAFLQDGGCIAKVTIPEGTPVHRVKDRSFRWWKAPQVHLGKICKITPARIESLLNEGANVHAANDYPIAWAAGRGSIAILKVLLNYGAKVNAQRGWPLQQAAHYNYPKVMDFLLANGADINAHGGIAVDFAVCSGAKDALRWLLNHGVDPKYVRKYISKYKDDGSGVTDMIAMMRKYVESR